MADYSIDFKKVDSVFQRLADTREGNAALEQLSKALDGIGGHAKELNSHELHYLLTNLVKQRDQAPKGPALKAVSAAPGSRVKGGFLIKTAVD